MSIGVPEIAIILGILCLCLLTIVGVGVAVYFLLIKKS
jgi:hypothetical protein